MCTHLHCFYAYNISYIKINIVKFEKFAENPFQNYLEIHFLTHTFRVRPKKKKKKKKTAKNTEKLSQRYKKKFELQF